MADEPAVKPPIPTENIPSAEGRISGLASANAPLIFFDGCPTMGHFNGIAHISLSALRFMPGADRVLTDNILVAHLRTNMAGLAALKEAIRKIELLAVPVPDTAKN